MGGDGVGEVLVAGVEGLLRAAERRLEGLRAVPGAEVGGLLRSLQRLDALGHVAVGRGPGPVPVGGRERSEEHTSELQSLMRISYAVFCLKKKKNQIKCTLYS